MRASRFLCLLIFLIAFATLNIAFTPQRKRTIVYENKKIASFEDTDAASKGLVSSLTELINSVSSMFGRSSSATSTPADDNDEKRLLTVSPTSADELRERIGNDYMKNNYLWTGKLDMGCFDSQCTFTDPTISFQGTATFQENTQNLVPLVTAFVENYDSILLDIQLNNKGDEEKENDDPSSYVETRWRMIGELNGLFWKPKIDVIGRTKFRYRKDEEQGVFKVYEYDEKWEIPAYQALLQLVTPAGTFRNSTMISTD